MIHPIGLIQTAVNPVTAIRKLLEFVYIASDVDIDPSQVVLEDEITITRGYVTRQIQLYTAGDYGIRVESNRNNTHTAILTEGENL